MPKRFYNQYILESNLINYQGEVISDDRDKAFNVDIAKEMSKPLEKEKLPVYLATVEGQTKYILTARSRTLGPIWGYISFNKVKARFPDLLHARKQNSGLGAEIATKHFRMSL